MLRAPAPFVFCLSLLTPLAASAQNSSAHSSAPAFEQFKTLVGDWEGTDSHGNKVAVHYEIVAGSVLMERLQPEGEAGMITMYSMDTDHIVAIHFCSAGNQPILETPPLSAATGKYNFILARSYGLKTPDELHMTELLVTFADKNHFTQIWTHRSQGKTGTNTISYSRKPATT
jgi:hypothetical protein